MAHVMNFLSKVNGKYENRSKAVVTQYHKYLSEHSLIKTVFDETLSWPPPKKGQANHPA
jgi:hypothetical protein